MMNADGVLARSLEARDVVADTIIERLRAASARIHKAAAVTSWLFEVTSHRVSGLAARPCGARQASPNVQSKANLPFRASAIVPPDSGLA